MLTRFNSRFFLPRHKLALHRQLSVFTFDDNQITVSFDGKSSDGSGVNHKQGAEFSFSTVFLRDACNAPESIDLSTKQKTFTTAFVAKDLHVCGTPSVVDRNGQKYLEVQWKHHDGSIQNSSYSEAFLWKSRKLSSRMEGKFFPDDKIFWTEKDLIKDMKSLNFSYHAYLEGESTFANALKALNRYGLCFINAVDDPLQDPKTQVLSESNSLFWPVAKLAKRFGYIKPTFYGTLFDVINDKNAKNIAYTNAFLPLHMDLCYYESPPGLQLLHFIKNSTIGGENVFADSFKAALDVKKKDPEAYEALKTMPITFHYNNNGEYYYYARPLIVEDCFLKDSKTGDTMIKEINYSPPFQGPFEMNITSAEDAQLFENFLRGMMLFEDAINERSNQYIVKTPENCCIVFDNRRILHSRLEFSDRNGGDRWLMGCYVDGDSYRSKLRTYSQAA